MYETRTVPRRSMLLTALTAAVHHRAPAAASDPIFSLQVPDTLVTLGKRGASEYLTVAGNFATGTLLSVQLLANADLRGLVLPSEVTSDREAFALAAALAALRDKASGVDATSAVLGASALGGGVEFEMTTPLVGDRASTAQLADPELSRRTVARALLLPPEVGAATSEPAGLLVLWAGAKQINFDAGDGPMLRGAAETFGLR